MEIEITRTKPQTEFMDSDKKFRAFMSGVGAGKTACGWMCVLEEAFKQPGSMGAIVAPTYPLIRDVILKERRTWIPDKLIRSYNKTDKEMQFINGSSVIFRSAKDDSQIDRLRGLSIAYSWIDEATLLSRLALEVLTARLRQPGYNHKLWMTGTPRKGWVHDLLKVDPSDEWFYVDQIPTQSNTFLDPGYVKSLKNLYTGNFYDQEVMGQWVDFEGLIWQCKQIMASDVPRKLKRTYYGIDIGWEHPSSIIVIQEQHGIYYAVDEFYKSHTNDVDIVSELKRMWNVWGPGRSYVDPSVPRTINYLNRAQLSSTGADNKVFDGLRTVRAMLDTGKLFISTKCINLIKEMEEYVWKEGDKEVPVEINDDACDALRYGIMGATKGTRHKSSGVVRGK